MQGIAMAPTKFIRMLNVLTPLTSIQRDMDGATLQIMLEKTSSILNVKERQNNIEK